MKTKSLPLFSCNFINFDVKFVSENEILLSGYIFQIVTLRNPLIVRPKKDGCYEIISGHRRKFAAEKIEYRKVPDGADAELLMKILANSNSKMVALLHSLAMPMN